MRVHWLQHADHEDAGCIGPWLAAHGHTVTHSALHAGAALPPVDAFDWLIVMGGPMNVYEDRAYPWLVPEKALIRQALVRGRRVLGVCLGAQLIADALGGPVTKAAEREIGWFDVTLTDAGRGSPLFAGFPERFAAFHWHGDTYALPPGAQHIARSAACAQQAFTHGARVAAIQFHLEVTHARAGLWLEQEPLTPARYVQTPPQILADPARFEQNNRLMDVLLERLAAA